MLRKELLSRPGSAAKHAKFCWSFAWKARRAELEVLATRAEEKSERARRITCIHDTTAVRGWLSEAAPVCGEDAAPLPMLLRATLTQYSCSRFGIMWPDGFAPLLQILSIANTHADQLTLAEFSAVRTRRLVQNLNMIAVARAVELGEKKKSRRGRWRERRQRRYEAHILHPIRVLGR